MAVEVGAGVIPIRPDMSGFAKDVARGVDSSMGGIKASFGKIAAAAGGVLAAAGVGEVLQGCRHGRFQPQ